jgi:SAM-dependent methyltransferase
VDARDWDLRYAESELVWTAGPNQFVASELTSLPPGRALDLAAGEGRNALWLAERGWEVTAVDFSQVGLDKGRALQAGLAEGAALRITWMCADVLTYDPGPGAYDLAVLAYLQLPAEQRREALRRAFSSLRDGGTFFVVAHDSTNLTEGTGGPQYAEVLYTAEDVLSDLDGERFEVVRAERVARTVPAPADAPPGSAQRTAYDALVHLVRTDPL